MKRFVLMVLFFSSLFVIALISTPIIILSSVNSLDTTPPLGNLVRISDVELDREINASSFQTGIRSEQITLRQGLLNSLIYNSIVLDVNPSYSPFASCTEFDCKFVVHQLDNNGNLLYGVTGVWVDLRDNQLGLQVGLQSNSFINIDTLISVNLDLEVVNGDVRVALRDVQLGGYRLPNFLLQRAISLLESQVSELDGLDSSMYLLDLNSKEFIVYEAGIKELPGVMDYKLNNLSIRDGRILVDVIYSFDLN
jgi:hypothetical protein